MTRRLPHPRGSETHGEESGAGGVAAYDEKAWAQTLLLLLDYAMVEGAQRDMGDFVLLLDLARKELEETITKERRKNGNGVARH